MPDDTDLDAWDWEAERAEDAEYVDPADDALWTEDMTWGGAHAWRTAGSDPAWLDTTADDPCAWWLGTHRPNWAWNGEALGPVFLSAHTLRKRRSPFPRSQVPIAIDSGGFTEVTQHGGWQTSAAEYVELVRRASRELGRVAWAAIQDWMCEDVAIKATGLSIEEHQRLTIESYRELVGMAPEIRWLPVVQGQTIDDYLRHVRDYDRAGVDLYAHQLVGLGSVCRRQSSTEIRTIVRTLTGHGLRLHGFGIKALGLAAVGDLLRSADSLAWSFSGRKLSHVEGKVDSRGRNLANSSEHAEAFRVRMLELIEKQGAWVVYDEDAEPVQLMLPMVG